MKADKNTKEPLIVYWAPHAIVEREHQQLLLDLKPKPLMTDIHKRRAKNPVVPRSLQNNHDPHGNGYQMCAALHTFAHNMFVLYSPFEVTVNLDINGSIIPDDYTSFFQERISSTENAFSVDFDIGFAMFCEEELYVTLMPPFSHQTNQPQSGYITFVNFDISSWFRPFVLIYQLWEGVRSLKVDKGEPLAYLKFNTDRPVELREFSVTPEINHMLAACADHKKLLPFQTMQELYERFHNTGMYKRVLKEIKKNLI
jgi:hypothetical protein